MVKTGFCVFLFLISAVTQAAVIATLDRTTIAANETVNLRYESSDEETRVPDFSPINIDFDIVGQNRQNTVNIINGAVQRKTIFELTLAPKRVGVLQIPQIQFSNAISASISINVKQSVQRDSEKDFNFTITADKTRATLQEQIILTVKLERAVNTTQENFSDLTFSHQDFILEPLSNRFNRYEAMINGRRHVVYERQFALFPQKTGSLLLNPITYTAVVPDNTSSRPGFFDNPFFGRAAGKTIRERSETLRLEIIDKPIAAAQHPWLPAKRVTVKNEMLTNNDTLRVGDSITQVLTLTAEQQLATALPDIAVQHPPNVQIYPDQTQSQQTTTANGITSQKIFRSAIVPTQAGDIVLPAQNLFWWNTDSQILETVEIPEQRLSVLPAIGSSNTNTMAMPTNPDSNSSDQALELAGANNHAPSFWFYLALFCLLGWSLTLLYVFSSKFSIIRRHSTDKMNGTINKQMVLKTAQTGDARKTKNALLAWASVALSSHQIAALDDLGRVIDNAELANNIAQLQASLYNIDSQSWDYKQFIHLFNQYKPQRPTTKAAEHLLFKIK